MKPNTICEPMLWKFQGQALPGAEPQYQDSLSLSLVGSILLIVPSSFSARFSFMLWWRQQLQNSVSQLHCHASHTFRGLNWPNVDSVTFEGHREGIDWSTRCHQAPQKANGMPYAIEGHGIRVKEKMIPKEKSGYFLFGKGNWLLCEENDQCPLFSFYAHCSLVYHYCWATKSFCLLSLFWFCLHNLVL